MSGNTHVNAGYRHAPCLSRVSLAAINKPSRFLPSPMRRKKSTTRQTKTHCKSIGNVFSILSCMLQVKQVFPRPTNVSRRLLACLCFNNTSQMPPHLRPDLINIDSAHEASLQMWVRKTDAMGIQPFKPRTYWCENSTYRNSSNTVNIICSGFLMLSCGFLNQRMDMKLSDACI